MVDMAASQSCGTTQSASVLAIHVVDGSASASSSPAPTAAAGTAGSPPCALQEISSLRIRAPVSRATTAVVAGVHRRDDDHAPTDAVRRFVDRCEASFDVLGLVASGDGHEHRVDGSRPDLDSCTGLPTASILRSRNGCAPEPARRRCTLSGAQVVRSDRHWVRLTGARCEGRRGTKSPSGSRAGSEPREDCALRRCVPGGPAWVDAAVSRTVQRMGSRPSR